MDQASCWDGAVRCGVGGVGQVLYRMLELLEPRVGGLEGGLVGCAGEDVECGQEGLDVVHLAGVVVVGRHMMASLSLFIAVDRVATQLRVYCVSPQ